MQGVGGRGVDEVGGEEGGEEGEGQQPGVLEAEAFVAAQGVLCFLALAAALFAQGWVVGCLVEGGGSACVCMCLRR